MRKRDLYLDDYPLSEGEIHGSTFIRHLQNEDLYNKGVRLWDELIDRLVDENIDSIVLVHNDKRYMSTVEDWQEYGTDAGFNQEGLYSYATYLPFSKMREN